VSGLTTGAWASRGSTGGPTTLDRLLRSGRTSSRDVLLDICGLVVLALVLMGAGLSLREPWPADEPRFALVAQDMLRSGDWLIPRIGGDLYADKPPLFFWLLATAMALTGSVRVGFLLPSLLAGIATMLLVYDLLRRAHGREVALAGAFMLLLTFQFTEQARQAQIDGVLCFLTTLSLYGLLRHVLLGPSPGWYVAGWAAAGLGVITKGVGFLPLLALVPFAILIRRGWPAPVRDIGRLSFVGFAAFLVAIGSWFVPMILVTSGDTELLAYRNEILFEQTVTRYANAWHHHEPFWYYLTNVIPVFWLPLIALVPWLWPRWRAALHERDTWVAVLLAWVIIVVLFFSASSGKRGLYVLPAVPALVMAAAPWLPELLRARGPRRLAFGLSVLLVCIAFAGAAYFALDGQAAQRVFNELGLHPVPPLLLAGLIACVPLALLRVREGWLAYAGVMAAFMVVIGFVINPKIDARRSGRAFIEHVEYRSRGAEELGLVGAKEQYLRQLTRPIVNFGHARWREREAEAADAAVWLAERPGRVLLMDSRVRDLCFADATAIDVGRANRRHWLLVSGTPNADCVRRGDPSRARRYVPLNAP
jgi:4-amino-4-deoxy-L-arabinose transferase-like glycosyltransferase